jgi:hypothetical protein
MIPSYAIMRDYFTIIRNYFYDYFTNYFAIILRLYAIFFLDYSRLFHGIGAREMGV